jgi:hypothetical protein
MLQTALPVDITDFTSISPIPQWDLIDAHLESALRAMTLVELTTLQESLQHLHRSFLTVHQVAGLLTNHAPAVAHWLHSRGGCDDTTKATMLLAALAVAIVWQTYRDRCAPANELRRAIQRVETGVAYTLPIPRHKPCFCGSDTRYRDCHGHPPIAVAKTA